jgi:hypothetical protein
MNFPDPMIIFYEKQKHFRRDKNVFRENKKDYEMFR